VALGRAERNKSWNVPYKTAPVFSSTCVLRGNMLPMSAEVCGGRWDGARSLTMSARNMLGICRRAADVWLNVRQNHEERVTAPLRTCVEV
jgi:hypothetical protein